MNSQQRDNWYFDILWSRIYDQDAKGPDITNFILGKKIEATARIGAIAYGKVQDDYGVYLSAVLRARFEELASGELIESLETRKANYFAILLKIIEEKISRHQDPDVFANIIDFLFNALHAETDLEDLASWAYICSSSNVCEELLAALLKARFKELITGVVGVVVPTEAKESSDTNPFPRYREEVKDWEIFNCPNDSGQLTLLSASVSKLVTKAISKTTAQRLFAKGINTGLELFKTNPQWLMINCNLDEEALQQIHDLFAGVQLDYALPKETQDFLKTPIEDLDLSVRCINAITAYNAGRPIEEQFITAGDIYKTSVHDFLKMRNVGKKQIREITELFANHNLFWS